MFDWVHEMSGSGEAAATQTWDDHSRTVLSAGKKDETADGCGADCQGEDPHIDM